MTLDNVLRLSMAIDDHVLAWGPDEPVHDNGTCSTDCAGDILARYRKGTAAQPLDVDWTLLASLISEYKFSQTAEWGDWPNLWERLTSIHGGPNDSSRREAGAMLAFLARLAASAIQSHERPQAEWSPEEAERQFQLRKAEEDRL